MKIAVITGAGSGFGREFAVQIDKKYHLDELWLIDVNEDALKEVAAEHKTACRILPYDLADEASYAEYAKLLETEKPNIRILVNSAGFGFLRAFQDDPLDRQMDMVDVNCKALMTLCYESVHYMKKGGIIYNFASTASFQPTPYEALYGATKAFVYSLSRALNVEYGEYGVHVVAICPHWTKTGFFDEKGADKDVVFDVFDTPKGVVKTALKRGKRGKDVSIVQPRIKVQCALTPALPKRLVMWVFCKQQHRPFH